MLVALRLTAVAFGAVAVLLLSIRNPRDEHEKNECKCANPRRGNVLSVVSLTLRPCLLQGLKRILCTLVLRIELHCAFKNEAIRCAFFDQGLTLKHRDSGFYEWFLWCVRIEPQCLGVVETVEDLEERVEQLLVEMADDAWARREDASSSLLRLGIPGFREARRQVRKSSGSVDEEAAARVKAVGNVLARCALEIAGDFSSGGESAREYLERILAGRATWTLDGESILVTRWAGLSSDEIRARLQAMTIGSLEFEETPLVEVLEFLSAITEIPIEVAPDVLEERSVEETQVSFMLRDLALVHVLDLLTDLLDLSYRVEQEKILVVLP